MCATTRLVGPAAKSEGAAAFFDAQLPTPPCCAESLAETARWFQRVGLDWGEIARHVSFTPDRYLRRPLCFQGGWEVVLCCWLPAQASPVHGHGGSVGVVRLLAGTLTETRYLGDGTTQLERRRVEPGEVLQEGREVIHEVANSGSTPAVSLHLYSPPLVGNG